MLEIKFWDELKIRRLVLIERGEGGSVFKITINSIYKLEFEDPKDDFYVIRYRDEDKSDQEIKVKNLELSREQIIKFHKSTEIIK